MAKIKFIVREKKGDRAPPKSFLLKDVNLTGEDFSGKPVDIFKVINSHFNHCRFENLKTGMCFGAGLTQSTYTDCSFDRSYLEGPVLGNARFVRCSFRDVVLHHYLSFEGEFIDCIFSGKIRQTVFYGDLSLADQERCKRKKNEFYGNDFSELDFRDTGFRGGVDLSCQKLPASNEYIYLFDLPDCLEKLRYELHNANLEKIIEKIKKKLMLTQDEKLKFAIDVWVSSREFDVRGGQGQYFLRGDELTKEVSILNKMIEILQKIAAQQKNEIGNGIKF